MIEARGLTKRYGARTALDGVSFTVREGELVGLLGLNGAGKTTAMNILAGCLNPTSGCVKIGGFDIAEKPAEAKRLIGYLPESLEFYGDLRVCEYLDFVCDLKGLKKARETRINSKQARAGERGRHLDEIAEKFGISGVMRRMLRNLSKGYRQRVGFAQAFIGGPKALILDEPTSGLDPSQLAEIRALVKDFAKTGAVIISSHILSEIQAMCDRAIVLINGAMAADVPLGRGPAAGADLETAFLDLVKRQTATR